MPGPASLHSFGPQAAGSAARQIRPSPEGVMAYICYASESDDPDLASAYSRVTGGRGEPANILRIHSLHAASLAAHHAYYREIMFGPSPLSRAQREMIAVAVSQINRCRY